MTNDKCLLLWGAGRLYSVTTNFPLLSTLPLFINWKKYTPGYVGMNNIKANDYFNVVCHALAHVPPLRNFFMLEDLLPFRDSNFAKLQTGKFQQNSLLRSISVRPAA